MKYRPAHMGNPRIKQKIFTHSQTLQSCLEQPQISGILYFESFIIIIVTRNAITLLRVEYNDRVFIRVIIILLA